MLIPNHPHDERLSALASDDPEALADSALSEHVASCVRCTDTVAELGALRASLAELPDLPPHRPLRLLPPVTDAGPSRVDRAGGWARRFFAPALTAGAAIAMVGLVGTTAPLLGGMAGQADSGQESLDAADAAQPETDAGGALGELYNREVTGTSEEPEAAGAAGDGGDAEVPAAEPLESEVEAATLDETGSDAEQFSFAEERSVWPMVLFAGVAIMIAAALLRWILAPRPE